MSMVPTTSDATFGLESVTDEDIVTPWLSIDQKELKYKNGLTGELTATVDAIVLGVLKTRTLWPEEVGNEPPECRSYDFMTGMPDMKNGAARFPWRDAGFRLADYSDDVGQILLECAKCPLKEWQKDPNGGKKDSPPRCTEVWTFPMLTDAGDGLWVPALFQVQRSGLKSVRSYVSFFQGTKTPMFKAVTRLSLSIDRKGQNEYATPVMTKIGAYDPNEEPRYISAFLRMRDFVTTPRTFVDEEAVSDSAPSNVHTPAPAATPVQNPTVVAQAQEPIQTQATEVARPVPAQAPTNQAAADDDLPF